MKRPPTDREVLRKIHKKYYEEYCAYNDDSSIRKNKIYVPIDCEQLAKDLNAEPDIIFGRLYYHLNKKYGYIQEDGVLVDLFAIEVDGDRHVINFPLLSAIVADIETAWFRFNAPLVISVIALLVSAFNV